VVPTLIFACEGEGIAMLLMEGGDKKRSEEGNLNFSFLREKKKKGTKGRLSSISPSGEEGGTEGGGGEGGEEAVLLRGGAT